MLEAELLLALGEPASAARLLAETDATECASDAGVGLAQLSLATGRPDAAIEAVRDVRRRPACAGRPAARVEAWLLDAIARDEIRDEEGALRALERALDLAEPRGLVRPVVRHGAPVRSLLRRTSATAPPTVPSPGTSCTRSTTTRRAAASRPAPLLEPLSERELAVLRFLPTMMSNTEIAAEMFVSVNTVKTHLKHIYRKLDVTDRRDAVRRGRELRLLSPGRAQPLGRRPAGRPGGLDVRAALLGDARARSARAPVARRACRRRGPRRGGTSSASDSRPAGRTRDARRVGEVGGGVHPHQDEVVALGQHVLVHLLRPLGRDEQVEAELAPFARDPDACSAPARSARPRHLRADVVGLVDDHEHRRALRRRSHSAPSTRRRRAPAPRASAGSRGRRPGIAPTGRPAPR
jgi:DNA-binding CsgD family transcriptional regulator